MEELSNILKQLEIDDYNENFEFIDEFKNPQKLPINQIHLEYINYKLKKNVDLDVFFDPPIYDYSIFDEIIEIIPALDRKWLTQSPPSYNFNTNLDNFLENNFNYSKLLKYLLKCNYHQFWCLILFENNIQTSLKSFLLNPLIPDQHNLEGDNLKIYQHILRLYQLVYKRLITSKESEIEYMLESTLYNYLIDLKLISLPIVITLNLVYENIDAAFVHTVGNFYFLGGDSSFYYEEVHELMNQLILMLTTFVNYIYGFEPYSQLIPIGINEKPPQFSINWTQTAIDYCLKTISTIRILLQIFKLSFHFNETHILSNKLAYYYDKIFTTFYKDLNGQERLLETYDKSLQIYKTIGKARYEFVCVYHEFITHYLDEALKSINNEENQEKIVECYLNLLNSALNSNEYLICDYHEIYDVSLQNELLGTYVNLDKTRTEYIVNCIKNLPRKNRLWQTLKFDEKSLIKTLKKYSPNYLVKESLLLKGKIIETIPQPGPSNINKFNKSDNNQFNDKEDMEFLIHKVLDMFPHLGDGFVFQCLEYYKYKVDDVIGAILEENLPPHLTEIPFDTIRIPVEPSSPTPVLAYKGKKPDYKDTLELLNDKKDIKQIKTFLLDGIEYTSNKYDVYDDEYDDRDEQEDIPIREYGEEFIKFNPNHDNDEVKSDTSYSDEEQYDDKSECNSDKKAFCENPAVLRSKCEGAAQSNKNWRQSKDVIGNPKGQGQVENVLKNRHKKNVNKSSRANHNRKKGAQWKRSRGMMPS